MLRREEIFREGASLFEDTTICGRLISSRCVRTRDSTEAIIIYSPSSMCWGYAWAVLLKSKGWSETADAIAEIIRMSGRCPKNSQTDMGKEFYNADVQKILKKHDVNHYSTYSTLKASSRAVQSHTQKRHVEDVYTQWQLQMDRRAAASRVRLQRVQASDYRHVTRVTSAIDSWIRCTAR